MMFISDMLIMLFIITVILPSTDGLVSIWINKPNASTYEQQGNNISMEWHYKLEKNKTFLSSRCFKNEPPYFILASRYQGEDRYWIHTSKGKIYIPDISISGTNDITLTVHKTEISYSGEYCFNVTYESNNKNHLEKMCINLFVYALPRITYLTPQLSCKQGDSFKLQCNATGYPEPRVEWIHKDTKEVIAHSPVMSLNITGKRSEGSYCCHVTNQYGNATNCTSVIVKGYAPVNTALSSNSGYIIKNKISRLQCRADAAPPAIYIFMQNNTVIYNSSDGIYMYSSTNITGETVDVRCIPSNSYGCGQPETITLPVYDLPKFTNKLRTRYNMTTCNITIQCSATGNPKPNITWTKGDTAEIIGTKEFYEVLYVNGADKTLIYYCHASNKLGSTKSTDIRVYVMTKLNCSSQHEDFREDTDKLSSILIPLGITLLLIVITILVIRYWKKIKECKCKEGGDAVDKQLKKEEILPMYDVEAQQPDEKQTDEKLCGNVGLICCCPKEV